jgi:hypothetical protein
MGPPAPDWRETARNAYRQARLLLASAEAPQSVEEEYFLDELQEALLDLKEAVVADDQDASKRHLREIAEVVRELFRIWNGNEENQ